MPARKTREKPTLLKPRRGYVFKKKGRKLALMRQRGGGGPGISISCECSAPGGGSCSLTIDPETGTASCGDIGCQAGCSWVLSVVGLANEWYIA